MWINGGILNVLEVCLKDIRVCTTGSSSVEIRHLSSVTDKYGTYSIVGKSFLSCTCTSDWSGIMIPTDLQSKEWSLLKIEIFPQKSLLTTGGGYNKVGFIGSGDILYIISSILQDILTASIDFELRTTDSFSQSSFLSTFFFSPSPSSLWSSTDSFDAKCWRRMRTSWYLLFTKSSEVGSQDRSEIYRTKFFPLSLS